MHPIVKLGIGIMLVGLIGGFLASSYFAYRSSQAFEFASAHGCALNEGSASPCVVNGKDYGSKLYNDSLSFIYIFGIAFVAAIVEVIGLIVLIIGGIASRPRSAAPPPLPGS